MDLNGSDIQTIIRFCVVLSKLNIIDGWADTANELFESWSADE